MWLKPTIGQLSRKKSASAESSKKEKQISIRTNLNLNLDFGSILIEDKRDEPD